MRAAIHQEETPCGQAGVRHFRLGVSGARAAADREGRWRRVPADGYGARRHATTTQIKTQAALCRGIDLVPMARVPANQYHYICARSGCRLHGHHGADGRFGRRSRVHRLLHALSAARTTWRGVRLCARRLRGRRRRRQDQDRQRAYAGDVPDRDRGRHREHRQDRGRCPAWMCCGWATSISPISSASPRSSIIPSTSRRSRSWWRPRRSTTRSWPA